MTILVINNKGQYNHRINRNLKYLNISSELVSNKYSVDEILSKKPIGLILGGGPSIKESGNSDKYIREINIPILGICLGHQLIGKVFGGSIASAESESYAKIKIDILEEDDIFRGIGSEMDVWASHKDEITSISDDFKVLASSKICRFETIKHKNRPLYGIQFHPEVHHTQNGEKIFENFHDICRKY
ncbi:MAG: GMP synthase subunit A [Methanobrevibacter sp.]|jgi:GMP synthase (glutamine-hydrolysing)|nr:GMP synthase subunit A [Candidatus Methanovirga basalitermitum]